MWENIVCSKGPYNTGLKPSSPQLRRKLVMGKPHYVYYSHFLAQLLFMRQPHLAMSSCLRYFSWCKIMWWGSLIFLFRLLPYLVKEFNLVLSEIALLWLYVIEYCHTRLHLGFSAKLSIWQVTGCKMEPRSGYIACNNPPTHPLGGLLQAI